LLVVGCCHPVPITIGIVEGLDEQQMITRIKKSSR